MKQNTHGGARNNAGRKKLPASERRDTITVYPKTLAIKKHGGKNATKKFALKQIEAILEETLNSP